MNLNLSTANLQRPIYQQKLNLSLDDIDRAVQRLYLLHICQDYTQDQFQEWTNIYLTPAQRVSTIVCAQEDLQPKLL